MKKKKFKYAVVKVVAKSGNYSYWKVRILEDFITRSHVKYISRMGDNANFNFEDLQEDFAFVENSILTDVVEKELTFWERLFTDY